MQNDQLMPVPQGNGEIIAQAQTDMQTRVDIMLANRDYVIKRVKPTLIVGVDVYSLPGAKADKDGHVKQSLGKSGAEKLATIFNLAVSFEIDKETMAAIGATVAGRQYVAYKAIVTSAGIFKGEGRGASFLEEMRNSYRMIFESEFNGLTDEQKESCQGPLAGTSKKTGKPYTFWRIPEPPVFDPLALNKAIKMAQKSAHVDAIIRVTGMSDLFTQDVEDMDASQFEPAETDTTPPAAPAPAPVATPAPAAPAPEPVKQAVPVAEGPQVLCTVADCGGVMKQRNGSKGPFYGCSNYTAKGCKASMNVHDYDAALAKAEMASGWGTGSGETEWDAGLGAEEIKLEDIPF